MLAPIGTRRRGRAGGLPSSPGAVVVEAHPVDQRAVGGQPEQSRRRVARLAWAVTVPTSAKPKPRAPQAFSAGAVLVEAGGQAERAGEPHPEHGAGQHRIVRSQPLRQSPPHRRGAVTRAGAANTSCGCARAAPGTATGAARDSHPRHSSGWSRPDGTRTSCGATAPAGFRRYRGAPGSAPSRGTRLRWTAGWTPPAGSPPAAAAVAPIRIRRTGRFPTPRASGRAGRCHVDPPPRDHLNARARSRHHVERAGLSSKVSEFGCCTVG